MMEEALLEEISAKLDILHDDLTGLHNDLTAILADTSAIDDATSANGLILEDISSDIAVLTLLVPEHFTETVVLEEAGPSYTISHFYETTLGDWVLGLLLLYLCLLQSFRIFFNATRGGSL